MKSLFCLCYRRDNTLLGVVLVEARAIMEARMFAAIDGTDRGADFAQGFELDREQALLVPATSVDRMISPDAARGLFAWIESECARKGLEGRVPAWSDID